MPAAARVAAAFVGAKTRLSNLPPLHLMCRQATRGCTRPPGARGVPRTMPRVSRHACAAPAG
eukprot:1993869-Prymnesium_polylepis.1